MILVFFILLILAGIFSWYFLIIRPWMEYRRKKNEKKH